MSSIEMTKSRSFERFAGLCAVFVSAIGFLYSVAFVIITRRLPELGGLLSALLLTVGGLLFTHVLVAIYYRLRATDAGFASWALLPGIAGALG